MICPKCGEEVPQELETCPNCGAAMTAPEQDADSQPCLLYTSGHSWDAISAALGRYEAQLEDQEDW